MREFNDSRTEASLSTTAIIAVALDKYEPAGVAAELPVLILIPRDAQVGPLLKETAV